MVYNIGHRLNQMVIGMSKRKKASEISVDEIVKDVVRLTDENPVKPPDNFTHEQRRVWDILAQPASPEVDQKISDAICKIVGIPNTPSARIRRSIVNCCECNQ